MSALLMPTRLDFDLLAPRLALANGALETLKHFVAQELLQRGLVSFREVHHDHLVSRLGAIEEVTRIEARIGAHQLGERARQGAVLGSVTAKACLDILNRWHRGLGQRPGAAARQGHHRLIGLRTARALLIRRRIRIEWLPSLPVRRPSTLRSLMKITTASTRNSKV